MVKVMIEELMARPSERKVSFVWNELSEHVVISITSMLISDHHLICRGDILSGASPATCVSGSGLYKCKFRSMVFELYVRYCEPYGSDRWVFYLDHERNRLKRDSDGLGN